MSRTATRWSHTAVTASCAANGQTDRPKLKLVPFVAVVGLVVDDDDVLLVAQLAAHPADHLVGRLGKPVGLTLCQNRFGELACGHLLARQKRMVVGYQNLGLSKLLQWFGGDDVA